MLYSQEGNSVIKFQSKCDEGFLLGYSSCSKAYRVYNKSISVVEETCDIEFDETNGSHEERDNLDDVRNDSLRNAIKNISIGDIRPKEEDEKKMAHLLLFG
jgi:Ser-tRNA(Ala) deacylase AlaX